MKQFADYLEKGTRVWDDVREMWGEVREIYEETFTVIFQQGRQAWNYGLNGEQWPGTRRTLHLTEWRPGSGEPMPALPEEKIEKGTVCAFWNDKSFGFFIGKYGYFEGKYHLTETGVNWQHAVAYKGELPEGFEFKN